MLHHETSLRNLERYGIRGHGLSLVNSCLQHREQFIHLNGYSSQVKPILLGILQGSILGPLLFNIYITSVSLDAKFVIYADDTSFFFFSGHKADDVIDMANSTLAKLSEWAFNNFLKVNSTKTNAAFFRPKSKLIQTTKHTIHDLLILQNMLKL